MGLGEMAVPPGDGTPESKLGLFVLVVQRGSSLLGSFLVEAKASRGLGPLGRTTT